MSIADINLGSSRPSQANTESAPKRRYGYGTLGAVLVGIVITAGVLAPWVAPYGPTEQLADANLLGPSLAHPLGTDEVNRDVLSRTLYGIRVNLLVAFLAVPIGAIIGAVSGLLAGMWQLADTFTQRVFDLLLAFPVLILAVAVSAALGPGIQTIAIVIIVAEVPLFGRLARTSMLLVREMPYVEAAVVAGAGRLWILRKHIMPNSLESLTVQLALSLSLAVFIEGAMSFLGLGVRPPRPSLGSLIRNGMTNIYEAPFLAVGPLVVVVMLTLGFLLIAQALNEAARR